MIKRNILFIIAVITLFGISIQKSEAVSAIPQKSTNAELEVISEEYENSQTDRINKVTFRDKFKKSPEAQINNFFKKYNKYSTKNNADKLKELYTDDYINNDGFDKETVFKMMESAAQSYKNVKYNTEIKNISVDENTAIVKVYETATGETVKPIEKLNGTGAIKSEMKYIDYLRKEGTEWKISNSIILEEKVELKYGEAKNATFDIKSPSCVSAGSEYEVSLTANLPSESFVGLIYPYFSLGYVG